MRRILLFAVLACLAATPMVRADSVPDVDTESILSPVLSPVNLRMMGVCEFAFVASDSRWFHKFPSSFRRAFPAQADQEAERTMQFAFEELTLIFDSSFGDTAGFHGAFLVTGAGSEPDTFSTPALLEGWGYYRFDSIQVSAGRVRNPFGGKFTDNPEYHLQAIDYRRFRGDGLRVDFDLGSGDFQLHPSLAILDRNPEDNLFLYSGRLGLAYQLKNIGTFSLGASFMYGEDFLPVDTFSQAGYINDSGNFQAVNFHGRYNVRRLDYGLDIGFTLDHGRKSFFGQTEFFAEIYLGKLDDQAFDDVDNPQNPQPFLGERSVFGWWAEIVQWLDIGKGGAPFVAYGYFDRGIDAKTQWGIGEQGIVRELVIGYRQIIARGFNMDIELWIVEDSQKLDENGSPDFNGDGASDLTQGNFLKVRFQFIF